MRRLKTQGYIWQPSELGVLKERYHKMSKTTLCNLLPDRTWDAIHLKANELGLRRPKKLFAHDEVPALKLEDWQAGWVAGIVDGEGSIGLWKYANMVWDVSVANTDEAIVRKLLTITGLGRISEVRHKPSSGFPHRKPVFYWRVRKKAEVYRLLKAVRQFLTGLKKEKANTLINALES